MQKLKPINANDSDFISYKFVGSTSVQEGQFCAVASADQWTNYITAYSGNILTTGTNVSVASIIGQALAAKKYFPILHYNPDIESIAATVDQNTYVTGYFGRQAEFHVTCVESGSLGSFTTGCYVCIGSTGKLVPEGKTKATEMIYGYCLSTINSTWLRVQAL